MSAQAKATKARKPAAAPVAPVATATATTVAPTPATPAQQPLYSLSAAAAALATTATPNHTLQAPTKGLGIAWRAPGYRAPNTRAAALAAVLAAHPGPFTVNQAQAALTAAKSNGLNLGSGSPRSYAVAFVKNGYFAPVSV